MSLTMRLAVPEDVPDLRDLIVRSVRGLQSQEYTPEQIEGAIGTVYGTDSRMIADGTFFVVESDSRIVACGGWSRRRTAFGSDESPVKDDSPLDPAVEPAKIRGFFVDPEYARQGIASRILAACESAAAAAGFRGFELVSTLVGVPLYRRHGYIEVERIAWDLPNGQPYTAVRMSKPAAGVRRVSGFRDAR